MIILITVALLAAFSTALLFLHFITLITYFSKEVDEESNHLWENQAGKLIITIASMTLSMFLGIILAFYCTLITKLVIPSANAYGVILIFILLLVLVAILFNWSIENGREKGRLKGKEYLNHTEIKPTKLTASDWFGVLFK
ncbi:MAG: hypothetical protein ACD_5C00023G0005 [uncultured bacterium]|nr:MAG: hypothetical protein ACD_5C00023G0005 [uncultured bacterium]